MAQRLSSFVVRTCNYQDISSGEFKCEYYLCITGSYNDDYQYLPTLYDLNNDITFGLILNPAQPYDYFMLEIGINDKFSSLFFQQQNKVSLVLKKAL